MDMNKLIIKKVESYTAAIKEQSFVEFVASKGNTKAETIIVDSRDTDTVIEAAMKYGTLFVDQGIYVVSKVYDVEAFFKGIKEVNNETDKPTQDEESSFYKTI